MVRSLVSLRDLKSSLRIALARALYRDPFLVVLDEPNSNLDAEGDQALTQAILGVRARGGIAIVVAHRTNAIACVDQLLVLAAGRVQAFGPKDQVLSKLVPAKPAQAVDEATRNASALSSVVPKKATGNGRKKPPGLKEPHGEEALVEPPLKLVTESGAP
jgi:ABC-type multidrug transport system ATPase subunit